MLILYNDLKQTNKQNKIKQIKKQNKRKKTKTKTKNKQTNRKLCTWTLCLNYLSVMVILFLIIDNSYLDARSQEVLQPTAWIPLLDVNETNGCLQVKVCINSGCGCTGESPICAEILTKVDLLL